jgi:hypothetical protein
MKLDQAKVGDLFCDDYPKLDTKYLVLNVDSRTDTITLLFVSSRKLECFEQFVRTKHFFIERLA